MCPVSKQMFFFYKIVHLSFFGLARIKTEPTSVNRLMVPICSDLKLLSIKSCVSIHIGINSIAWTSFSLANEKAINVNDWNYYQLPDKKLHLAELLEIILYLINKIPVADIFVFESQRMAQAGAPGTPAMVNINVQRAQIFGMLAVGLKNKKDNATEKDTTLNENDVDKYLDEEKKILFQNDVIYMKPYLMGRYVFTKKNLFYVEMLNQSRKATIILQFI